MRLHFNVAPVTKNRRAPFFRFARGSRPRGNIGGSPNVPLIGAS